MQKKKKEKKEDAFFFRFKESKRLFSMIEGS